MKGGGGKEGKNMYHGPVNSLQFNITCKTVINRRHSTSPHQSHDAEIIELDPERCDFVAVVIEGMVSACVRGRLVKDWRKSWGCDGCYVM